MAQLLRDTKFALRMLRKRWGITLIAVGSLAVAIGGNTAVFSLISAILLQPTSVVDADHVMLVQERLKAQSQNVNGFTVSEGTWRDLRERSRTADSWAALRFAQRGLRGTDRTETVNVSEVTAGFFEFVGAPLKQGRGFRADETVEGSARVAVIRPEFWEREFGGEDDPLGAILTLDGEAHEVIGVLPDDFQVLLTGSDVWLPLVEATGEPERERRTMIPLARLSAGANAEAFEAEIAALSPQLALEHPQAFEGWTLDVLNYGSDIPSTQTKTFYALLQGSVFFVLLIACVNVTNLLLARGQERRREIAIRLTLGAGGWRIVRQLLTESMMMVAAGALLGLAIGWYGIRLMVNSLSSVLPASIDITLDGRVLVFTLLVSAITGLVFGLAPALQTLRSSQAESVQGGRSSANRSRKMLSRSLVVAEIALSLVALGGGGALVQSFLELRGGEPGFDTGPVLTARLRVPPTKYPDDERSLLLLEQIIDRSGSLNGVTSAAAVNALPRGFGTPTASFQIRGEETEEGSQAPQALTLLATPGYLDTLGIELLQGRFFETADRLEQSPVAVVNRAFVDTWMPGENPIGRRLELRDEVREIVGVVEDVQQVLIQTPGGVQSETIYTPMAQSPPGQYFVTLRVGGGDPRLLTEPLRNALHELDPDLTVSRILTIDDVVDRNFAGINVFNTILGGFGILAILLAAVGSYGVLAYSVSQRSNEIGIRMALGAEGRRVVWMVSSQGVMLAVIGLALGGLLTYPVIQVVRSLMEGINTVSGNVAIGVAVILFLVTALASLLPAYRAARVDPVTALQQE